ncbi:hypothetical protein EKO27_g10035 [Xylaria grammica]|uniref:Uncharacterized protein n=1 Tax=Xylaria grammica TaxID=363999 RepID=A0A439CSF1_9PEZI|nr:hypothetical protein EKO27_g10035 [Xylaria grammica]
MTDQVSGSSLPQARDLGRQHQEQPQEQPRRHTHLHYRNVHSSHQHNHQHIHHVRSQRDRKVDRRDTSDDGSQNASDVVVIVETISVLQVTDVSGSTIIRTLPHDYSATPVGVTSSSTESIVAGTTDQPSSSTYLQDITSTSSASDDGNGVAGPSSSSSTAKPDVTPANGGDGIGSPTDTGSGGDSVSTSASASGSDSGNASAATIAGSVVGAISGLAIILILAAVILRWKKRQSSTKLIQGSGNDRGYGAMTTGGSGAPPLVMVICPNGGGRSHSLFLQRWPIYRAMAASQGFGGDGYTDPRATRISDQSIDYRASQNFFGEAPLSRLALGAPMLQETSIPVFHASPARTAVETRGPFSDPFSDDHALDPPTLAPDPIYGRHLRLAYPLGAARMLLLRMQSGASMGMDSVVKEREFGGKLCTPDPVLKINFLYIMKLRTDKA